MTDVGTYNSGDIHVLHVDDEQEALWFSKIFLEGHEPSLTIDQCDSPFQALKIFRERSYDCVVLDVAMPYLDGLDFVRRLRVFSRVPVILYTHYSAEEIAEEAKSVGADYYIQKTFDPSHYEALAECIMKAVIMGPRVESKLRCTQSGR
ncbi:MAG: response regulator [Candidatus Bathyarchaeota archaeon]|nr:MAG: response regulator [Candidatus Bathyarchaeota archaeon]